MMPSDSSNLLSRHAKGHTLCPIRGQGRPSRPAYVGDEQIGGYDARRYDFDLTGVDADIKKAMALGNTMGMRQTRDCRSVATAKCPDIVVRNRRPLSPNPGGRVPPHWVQIFHNQRIDAILLARRA